MPPRKKIDARGLVTVCGKQFFLRHMLEFYSGLGSWGPREKHVIIDRPLFFQAFRSVYCPVYKIAEKYKHVSPKFHRRVVR